MRRTMLLSLILLAGAGVAAIAAPSPGQVQQAIDARALDSTPESRMEGERAIDAAIAASLIGAVSSEFDKRQVEVKLDRVEVAPAGLVQRDVRGNGRLLIGEDAEWIPFRFAALYDTQSSSVDYPSLVLGTGEPGQSVATGARMARQLENEVDRRLDQEFAGQAVRFALDEVQVSPAGGRYQQLQANGIADFGAEGRAVAGVQALYDPRSGQWLHVRYELGANANRQSSLDEAVARR